MIDLRAERLNRGLSIAEAERQMGLGKNVLGNAERGVKPHPSNALKIANFYDRKVTDIWPVDEPEVAAA